MLTVPDYGVGKVFHGRVFFSLRVYDPNFDPSPFIGVVFAAQWRGEELVATSTFTDGCPIRTTARGRIAKSPNMGGGFRWKSWGSPPVC